MYKERLGILLLAAMMILCFPMRADANSPIEDAVQTEKSEEAAEAETPEAYCAYAIDTRLYAFVQLEENQDPDSFFCDIKSEDITNKEFLYLRAMQQTDGNVHYIFIIDNSSTMKRYKEEINAYLQSISENAQMKSFYTLATFGERFNVVKEKMTDINTLLYEVDQISFQEKYTDSYTAVKSVYAYLDTYQRGGGDLVSVVLITDGQPDLSNKEEEAALAMEASQEIISGTDVIYSTFCTENWAEAGKESLTEGKGPHELVADTDDASDAGKRITELLDNLYCVCFELEKVPVGDFSFEMIMGFGKDFDGNRLDIGNPIFDSIHNIKIQNQDISESEEEEPPFEIMQEGGFDDGEIISIDDTTKMDLSNHDEDVFSEPEPEEGNRTIIVIICGVCAVVAVIALFLAILVVRAKGGNNAPRKVEKTRITGAGIPLKLEIYSGRCRNQSAFLNLYDSLIIGSSANCDIIFDDSEVAAENSRIKLIDGLMYIEDLNSPQGTALDGMQIQGQNKIRGREVISIGSVEFSILPIKEVSGETMGG